MIASPAQLVAALVAVIFAIAALYALGRLGLSLLTRLVRRLPPGLWGLRDWAGSHPLKARFVTRYPRLYALLYARLRPHAFTGLPLTLMIAAALYLAALFGGLIEDLLMKEGLIRFDAEINAFFEPYRAKPLLDAFLWITGLGSSPAVVAAAVIATGFLWADRRVSLIGPLWITLLGAEATTWAGKFLIGRARPQFLDVASALSPSFPSGHATASMAVYGFLAYAIARDAPNLRARFEVAFWTMILIVLIGFSRIFLSVHFTSDVLSGFLVGGFWLLVGFALAERARPPASPAPSPPHLRGSARANDTGDPPG